jgi:hypothetical protein
MGRKAVNVYFGQTDQGVFQARDENGDVFAISWSHGYDQFEHDGENVPPQERWTFYLLYSGARVDRLSDKTFQVIRDDGVMLVLVSSDPGRPEFTP